MADLRFNPENLLALDKGVLVADATPGLSDDGVFSVRWPIPQGALEEMRSWARTNRTSLKDPAFPHQQFTGYWRSSKIEGQTDRNGDQFLVQTFSQGYITSLVTSGVLDWTDARLLESTQAPADSYYCSAEDFLNVVWTGIAPGSVETIKASIDALDADTFSPKIEGVAYGTLFHRLFIGSGVDPNGDGSGKIVLTLARPESTFKSYDHWQTDDQRETTHYLNIPRKLAQGVVEAAKALGVSVVSLGYNSGQRLVDVIVAKKTAVASNLLAFVSARNCDAYTASYWYWNLSSPTLYPLPSATDPGFTYESVPTNNRDGTYDVRVDITVRNYRDYAMRVAASGALESVQERQQLGLTDSALIMAPNTYGVQGVIYRTDVNVRPDCSKDVTTTATTSVEHTLESVSLRSAEATGTRFATQNGRSPVAIPATVDRGTIYQKTETYQPDGTYSGALERVVATPTTWTWTESAELGRTQSRTEWKAKDALVTLTAHVPQVVAEVTNQMRPDGLYDVTSVITASAQKTIAGKTVAADSQGTETLDRIINATSIPTVTPERGWVYRLDVAWNRDSTYNTDLRTATPTATVTEWLSGARHDASETSKTETAQSALASSSFSQGKSITVGNRMRPDGLYDRETRTVEAYARTSPYFKTQSGPRDEVQESRLLNQTAIPTVPKADSGFVYGMNLQWNADGTYNADLTYQKETYAQFSKTTQTSILGSQTTNTLLATATPADADAAVIGVIQEVTNTPRRDGLYDVRVATNTATAVFQDWTSENAASGTATTTRYRNKADPLDGAGVPAVGTIIRVDQSYNQDGTVNGEKVEETSTPMPLTWRNQTAAWETVTTKREQNLAGTVTVPSAALGYIYRVTQAYNRDGTVTGETDATYEDAHQMTKAVQFGRLDNTYLTTKIASPAATSAEALGAITQGVIYEVSNQFRPDGLYNVQESVRTSTECAVYVYEFNDNGMIYTEVFRNRRTLGSAYPTSNSRRSVSINPDGTYDGQIMILPWTPVDNWDNVEYAWDFKRYIGDPYTYTCGVKQTKSAATAGAWVSGIAPLPVLEGSAVKYSGRNRWIGIYVTGEAD